MFTDSDIAKKMSCGETKSMYVINYGLAPYYRCQLERKLKNRPFVLMFDETLNKEMQQKQLDIIVRHWDDNSVQSSYYTSEFLGHACAVDLVHSFENTVETKLGFANLVQLAMDGPNVNWSTFDKLQKKLEKEHKHQLLNIGSCGLHQLHNALKAGVEVAGWDLSHSMSAMHKLFDNVPARREDYETDTETDLYALSVCSHRWCENVKVCERAIKLVPSYQRYIKCVEKKRI